MVEVKVDLNLLNDFYALVLELRQFMSMNMIHLDSFGKTPEAKKKLGELSSYSIANVKTLDIFKEPVMNNSKYNIELLSKNLNKLLHWIHQFLSYSGSVLKDYYPEMYKKRFTLILGLYVDFRDKHGIN